MDGGESPLEVLSRAATMIQENQQVVSSSPDDSKQGAAKQLPTTKWKRDRRTRPEYSRKSDPKIAEVFGQDLASSPIDHDIPLDMSVRQRGQPPSYTQTINNPGYRSNYRGAAKAPTPNREEVPSGISMCDPIIDEHFRRSLGKDYVKVFATNNNVPAKETIPVMKTSSKVNCNNVVELIDNASLSVDDHFAKALGDTWLKLNKKESDHQSADKETVMSV